MAPGSSLSQSPRRGIGSPELRSYRSRRHRTDRSLNPLVGESALRSGQQAGRIRSGERPWSQSPRRGIGSPELHMPKREREDTTWLSQSPRRGIGSPEAYPRRRRTARASRVSIPSSGNRLSGATMRSGRASRPVPVSIPSSGNRLSGEPWRRPRSHPRDSLNPLVGESALRSRRVARTSRTSSTRSQSPRRGIGSPEKTRGTSYLMPIRSQSPRRGIGSPECSP